MGRRQRGGVQGDLLASDDGGKNEVPEAEAGPPPGDAAPTAQATKLRQARDLTVQRRLDEAVSLYREIAQDDSHNVKARNNLGVLYDELGHHDLALEQFEAARALDPDGVEVLVNLASALGSLGRFDDAERELGRAQMLAPEEISVRAGPGHPVLPPGLVRSGRDGAALGVRTGPRAWTRPFLPRRGAQSPRPHGPGAGHPRASRPAASEQLPDVLHDGNSLRP